jgi:hypothetical protein
MNETFDEKFWDDRYRSRFTSLRYHASRDPFGAGSESLRRPKGERQSSFA